MLIWSKWKSPPNFSECLPITFEKLSDHCVGVVHLRLAGDVHADSEIVKRDVFDAFDLRRQGHDAGITLGIDEALRNQAGPTPPTGCPTLFAFRMIAEVDLVDRGRAERLGQAEAQQLGPAQGDRVESGHVGAALRRWIGIIERVVVHEVVGGNHAEPRITVES